MTRKLLFLLLLIVMLSPVIGDAASIRLSDLGAGGTFSSATSDKVVTVRNGGGVANPDVLTTLACSSLIGVAASCSTDTTTTSNITDSTNKRFITDAQQTVLASTSGVNTGDQIVPANTTATANNFFTAYASSTGMFSKSQPACGTLSDSTAFCSATGTQATAALNVFSSTLQGVAPASGGGTSNFLRADGSWAGPSGAGTVSTTGSPANGNLTEFSGATTITNGDLSGDCTTSGTLSTTCTKTGGVAFASSATTDATNATNIDAGTLPAARLPNPTSTTLGGIQSFASAANQMLTGLTTSGVLISAAPTNQTITLTSAASGSGTTSIPVTLAAPTASSLGGVEAFASSANVFLTGLTTGGQFISAAAGGSVTWPATGDIVVSNSTNSPTGISEVDGQCVIGTAGSWVAGSCSGSGSGVSSFSGDGDLLNNSSSIGAVTATLTSAGAKTVWGNTSASPALPAYTSSPVVAGSSTAAFFNLTNAENGYEIAGSSALSYPTPDTSNASVAIGQSALSGMSITAAYNDVAIGQNAMSNTLTSTAANSTFVGVNSGESVTSGASNTGVGYKALANSTTDGANTAVGYQALKTQNMAGVTALNTAIGYEAAETVSTGTNDTVIGGAAAITLTTGPNNVAVGASSFASATTDGQNVAVGASALSEQKAAGTTALNTAVGYSAGKILTTAANDTFIGGNAGAGITTGPTNVAVGTNALLIATTDGQNVAVGYQALSSQKAAGTTALNTAVGYNAGQAMTTGVNDTIIGGNSGSVITIGSGNSLLGASVAGALTSGSNNTILGASTGPSLRSGSNNTIIGQATGAGLASGSNNILIGVNSAIVTLASGTSNTIQIGGTGGPFISATGTSTNTTENVTGYGTWNLPNLGASSAATTGTVCWTTATGLLNVDTTTTCLLSLEELKDIKDGGIKNALSIIEKIKPFWFTWKKETPEYAGDKYEQAGMGAHQVEGIEPRLAAYTPEGKLKGVRYQEMTAVLVKGMQEQQLMINGLQSELAATHGAFPFHKCFFDLLVCGN